MIYDFFKYYADLENPLWFIVEVIFSIAFFAFPIIATSICYKKNKNLGLTFLWVPIIYFSYAIISFKKLTILFTSYVLDIGFFLLLVFWLLEFSYFLLSKYFAKRPVPNPPLKKEKLPKPHKLTDKERIAQLEREMAELKATKKDE